MAVCFSRHRLDRSTTRAGTHGIAEVTHVRGEPRRPDALAETGAGVPEFPYRVSHLDPERFILHSMFSTAEDVTWRVEVHWLCNGQSGVLVADLAGEPFGSWAPTLVVPHAERRTATRRGGRK